MANNKCLKDVVARIEDIDRQIATIMRVREENWRHSLVRARRELAEAVAAASAEITSLSNDRDPHVEDLRTKLSAFRHALALHQANHPASSIDNSQAYKLSNDVVRCASQSFVESARYFTEK